MVTVTTKAQLKKAIEAKENRIVIEGELAKQILRRTILKNDKKVNFYANDDTYPST